MRLDAETAAYLHSYFERSEQQDAGIEIWKTKCCAECGEFCPGLIDPDNNTIEHLRRPEVMAAKGAHFHWVDTHVIDTDGYVLVGCEGYWMIDPNKLGWAKPNWQDWTTIGDDESIQDLVDGTHDDDEEGD